MLCTVENIGVIARFRKKKKYVCSIQRSFLYKQWASRHLKLIVYVKHIFSTLSDVASLQNNSFKLKSLVIDDLDFRSLKINTQKKIDS